MFWKMIFLNILLLQYDGSNDDLDWRIDFRCLNSNFIVKYLRFTLIKDCFIKWKHLRLSNLNLQLDLTKTSFFNRLSRKFYIVWKKKSAQSVYFYWFYSPFKFYPKTNMPNFCSVNMAVKPVKIAQLSWFFFQNYVKFFA